MVVSGMGDSLLFQHCLRSRRLVKKASKCQVVLAPFLQLTTVIGADGQKEWEDLSGQGVGSAVTSAQHR